MSTARTSVDLPRASRDKLERLALAGDKSMRAALADAVDLLWVTVNNRPERESLTVAFIYRYNQSDSERLERKAQTDG